MQTLSATQINGQISGFTVFGVLKFWKTHSCSSVTYFLDFELPDPSEMQQVFIIYDEHVYNKTTS